MCCWVVLLLVCLRLSNNGFTLALVFIFSLLYNFHVAICVAWCGHFGCPTIIFKPQFIIQIWLKIVMPPTLPTPPSVVVSLGLPLQVAPVQYCFSILWICVTIKWGFEFELLFALAQYCLSLCWSCDVFWFGI